jgi:uncharacterized membrane protein required for colicin V production
MPTINWVDILFIATVVLLVFNGFRNGAVFSLINLLTIPIGFVVAYVFGPPFTQFLARNGLPGPLIISYIILFFGTVFVIHFLATMIHGVVRRIPLIGFGDSLFGAVIGFVEAWLLWVVLLAVLGTFLGSVQGSITSASGVIPGVNISMSQLQQWHDFYNTAVTQSLFARVNSFIIRTLPHLPTIVPGSHS